jgi:hypothetical protein
MRKKKEPNKTDLIKDLSRQAGGLIETPAAGLVRMFKKVINENDKDNLLQQQL